MYTVGITHKTAEASVPILICSPFLRVRETESRERQRDRDTETLTERICFAVGISWNIACLLLLCPLCAQPSHLCFSAILIFVTSSSPPAPQHLEKFNPKAFTLFPICLLCHFGANWLTQPSFKCKWPLTSLVVSPPFPPIDHITDMVSLHSRSAVAEKCLFLPSPREQSRLHNETKY